MLQQRKVHRRRRHRRGRWLVPFVLVSMLSLCVSTVSLQMNRLFQVYAEARGDEAVAPAPPELVEDTYPQHSFDQKLNDFAKEHQLSREDWPEELLEKWEKRPELESFVLNYPLKKDQTPTIDLSDSLDSDEVPLLLQWDERWGYEEYSGEMMAFSGCGPTCLSMVSIHLLQDAKYTPSYIAEFSRRHGYSVPGRGSAWTLISEGGRKLGLEVIEIPLNKKRIMDNLKVGNPIICVMGPGDFTTTGHFIVMTGCEQGKIKVNDPNSREKSEILWTYEDIQDQIRGLWVCR